MRTRIVILSLGAACVSVSVAMVSCSDTGNTTDASTDTSTSPDTTTKPDTGTPTDAGTDTSTTDAGDGSTAACTLSKPFGAPQPITTLNGPLDQAGGRLWSDELTLYYYTPNEAGVTSVHSSLRTSKTNPFASGTAVDLGGQSAFPTVTNDGLSMFFETSRGGGSGGVDIFRTNRASVSVTWPADAASSVPLINTTLNEGRPYLRGDGSEIYWISRFHADGGANDTDLYRATFSGGTVGAPSPVTELNSTANEYAIVVTADGLTAFFARNNTGDAGTDYDIWTATRSSTAAPFSGLAKVTELNGPTDEIPTWVSADGCTLYLSAVAGDAGYNLFIATRPL